jgi:hypothetical protein
MGTTPLLSLAFNLEECHHGNAWGANSYRFENIVKGIKNSKLRHSLKALSVYWCEIGKEKAQQILDSHGLNSITANEDYCYPME